MAGEAEVFQPELESYKLGTKILQTEDEKSPCLPPRPSGPQVIQKKPSLDKVLELRQGDQIGGFEMFRNKASVLQITAKSDELILLEFEKPLYDAIFYKYFVHLYQNRLSFLRYYSFFSQGKEQDLFTLINFLHFEVHRKGPALVDRGQPIESCLLIVEGELVSQIEGAQTK